MYITPVQFQQFTNREDFTFTLGVWDDDLGTQINITGCVLNNPAAAFTSSNWNVVANGVVTTSSTSLTIPVPPITTQLQSVTLTVGTNLAISPGGSVAIIDHATGLNSMQGYVTSYTASSGVLVCQIGFTFQFEIRGETPNNTGAGYIAWYDFGTPDDQGPILQATLANYLTIVDQGTIQCNIPESVFKTILDVPYNSQSNTYARTFLASMTMTDSINTRQLFVGRLPVLYGGVTN